MRRRVSASTQRGVLTSTDPICRVVLNVDAGLLANTDSWAQNNWVVGTRPDGTSEDPDGLATLSASLGVNSYITIPHSGRYLPYMRGVFTAPAGSTTCVSFIARNSATAAASIARDPRNTSNAGADGTQPVASRPVYLNAGDVLYWGHWSGAAITLKATNIGVPTEMSLTWLGTR